MGCLAEEELASCFVFYTFGDLFVCLAVLFADRHLSPPSLIPCSVPDHALQPTAFGRR